MNIKTRNIYAEGLSEILLGTDIRDLEWILQDFENDELYEECAGMKMALDSAKTKTIEEIELEYLELIGKNHEQ